MGLLLPGFRAELFHDGITSSLVHITVYSGDGEVVSGELVGEPANLLAGVAEDDGPGNGDDVI